MATNIVKLRDRYFEKFLSYGEIISRIEALANRINNDYANREQPPLFIGVLNGSFMFCSELMQRIAFDCEVSFVKLSSYEGLCSSGVVAEVIGLCEEIRGRDIVIVEDIVETGASVASLMASLEALYPATINVASLLFKPGAFKERFEIRYSAMEISDDFTVGFGMDYCGLGRNLKDIYKITNERK